MADIEMKMLELAPDSSLLTEGYASIGFGVVHSKSDIFSDSHDILQTFLYNPPAYDYTWSVKYENDSDATRYPEVYSAWIAAGGEENLQTIVKAPELQKWAVGFGGKKNAERAAKLALAVSIAADSELTPKVARSYPRFAELLNIMGVGFGEYVPPVAGAWRKGCGKGDGGGGGARVSPYEQGKASGKNAAPASGGDPEKDALVAKVKELQRTSEENKQFWWGFCTQLGGINDPSRHDKASLQLFLSYYEEEPAAWPSEEAAAWPSEEAAAWPSEEAAAWSGW